MSKIVLSLDELKEACGYRGERQPQARTLIRWLRENGFRYKLGLDGYPLVSRAHYEAVMCGAPRAKPPAEPNLEWLVNRSDGPQAHPKS